MSRTTIGKYVDLELIGQGGMAEVYIGTDPTLSRKVAIKLILPHFSHKDDFTARFQREAKTIAGLRHNNIVQIYEYAIEDGTPYMVMEYLGGGTLSDIVAQYKAEGRIIPFQEAAALLDKIASGLDYAHERGLIHRDIKPANILISDEGEPIIADFGIVKLLDEAEMLTMTGGIVGSPRYIPPEQVSQQEVDKRGDIYSLGIILYQMVTGEVPFTGEVIKVLMQHVNNPPVNPITLNPDLPEDTADVILKALEKDPNNRYASVGEMAQAFRDGLAETAVSVPTKPLRAVVDHESETFVTEPQEEKSSSNLPLPLIGGVLGLIVLAIVAFLVFGGGGGDAADETTSDTNPPVSTTDSALPGDEINEVSEGEPTPVPTTSSALPGMELSGTLTYTFDGRVYRLEVQEGAVPEDISLVLEQLSPGGSDRFLNISPDGEWLIVETERFAPECADWSCLAVLPADLSSGEAIRAIGEVVHPEGFSAIASGGNLIVYPAGDGVHEVDLWAIVRSGDVWGEPLLLTADSPHLFNYQPALSDDGSTVVFNCGADSWADEGAEICEVGTDGAGFRVVLTPADSPEGFPTTGALHQPDYTPDGGIVFEADWNGERIWHLPLGGAEPILVAAEFGNDNSPCVLSDGSIVSLWLERPQGNSVHEFKVMLSDGSSFLMILLEIDISDSGIGCAASAGQ